MYRLVSTYIQHIMPSGGGNVESILPAGYTQLKCIIAEPQESSSEQVYFRVTSSYGVTFDMRDAIEFMYKPVQNINSYPVSSSDSYLWVYNKSSYPTYEVAIHFPVYSNRRCFASYYTRRASSSSSSTSFKVTCYISDDSSYEDIYYHVKLSRDNSSSYLEANDIRSSTGNTGTISYNTFCFMGYVGFSSFYAPGKYDYLKIYDWSTNELKLHWVPALEDATGIAGFYDVVNNKFIAPKQGVAAYETL